MSASSIVGRVVFASFVVLFCVPSAALATSFDRLDSEDFEHLLEFDDDGVLPSEEAPADGWVENGGWVIDGDAPPSLSIVGGAAVFDTVGLGSGSYTIEQQAGSAWETEINPEVSYTFEVRLRVTGEGGTTPGAAIWLANGGGADSAVLTMIKMNEVRYGIRPGELLDEGDNSADFVVIRIAHDAVSDLNYMWRNGVPILRAGVGSWPDARVAMFLVDFGRDNQAGGEFDYVRWDATGAYAPLVDPGDTEGPAAPTGLATVEEDGRVLLDWADNTDDFLCYNLYRSQTAGGPHTVLVEGIGPSEFIDDEVSNGTTYYFTVRAVDTNENESGDSNEASATPTAGVDVTPPAMPIGLVASSEGGNIFLDWNDNTDEDLAGYLVSRAEVAGGPYSVLDDAVPDSEFEDSSVDLQVRYYYIVEAKDDADNLSPPTGEVTAIVTIGIGDEIQRDSDEFGHGLEFEDDGVLPSVEGAADGWIETGAWVIDGTEAPSLSVAGGSLAFDSAGLGEGGGKFFDFQQPAGASAWSSEIDATTSYTFEARLKVSGPSGDDVTVTNPGASIWLANASGGAALTVVRADETRYGINPGEVIHTGDNGSEFVTFRVAYDAGSGLYNIWRDGALIASSVDASLGDNRAAVFLIDFGSTNESTGEFDYVRWDSTGAYWPPRDGSDLTPPAAPTGLVATSEDSRVTLSWAPNTEPDLGSYQLARSETPGGPHDVIAETGATGYVDENVINGVEYYYVVMAVDVNRNVSDPSSEVEATPDDGIDLTPPAPPTGVRANSSRFGEVVLNWNLGPEFDLDTYSVYRSETSGEPYDLIAEGVPALETTYLDDAVSLGTTYYYVITATDLSGNESDPSAEVDVTPEDLDDFPERNASTFAHQLLFEDDGVLPSEEGAEDGWLQGDNWVVDGEVAPSLSVTGGSMVFDTVGVAGGFDIRLSGPDQPCCPTPELASAWQEEVGPDTSYTFEVRVKITGEGGAQPGFTVWLSNGDPAETGFLQVRMTDVVWGFAGAPGEISLGFGEQDNSSDFVNIRMSHHAPSGTFWVWRDDELIGEALGAGLTNAAGDRHWVILCDFGGNDEVAGELDYVAWDASGAYAPGAGGGGEPRFIRGDADAISPVNLTDGIFVLNFLFAGGPTPPCRDAADANGDNNVNITDGVYILNFLFAGGTAPSAPYPDCGVDPDGPGGPLDCFSFPNCP